MIIVAVVCLFVVAVVVGVGDALTVVAVVCIAVDVVATGCNWSLLLLVLLLMR